MQRWQQIAVKATSRKELDDALVRYSSEGWELVGVTSMTGMEKVEARGGVYHDVPWREWDLFFKRPAQD